MSESESQFIKLSFLGGLTAEEVWPILNPLFLPSWILLMLAPKWKHTFTVAYVLPLLHALLYTLVGLSIVMGEAQEDVDFLKLNDIVRAFANPNIVFYGWLHYLCFDTLVGRWIVMDSQERCVSTKFHYTVMVPILVLTLMLAPSGWLVYNIVIRVRSVVISSKEKKS